VYDGRRRRVLAHEDELIRYTRVASVLGFSLHMCRGVDSRNHDSKATLRRFGSRDASSPCASFLSFVLSRGAFVSGAVFGFFFTMTPLRDAFGGFLEGAGAVFGAAVDTDSAAGTGGDDFTVTLAATALYCEMRVSWQRDVIRPLLPEGFQFFSFSLLALAFLQFLTLPDRVKKHDLILFESAELVR